MNSQLRLSTQTALGIFVALLLGYINQGFSQGEITGPVETPNLPKTSTPTPSVLPTTLPLTTTVETLAPPRPFETLPGVWMVQVVAYPDSHPIIVDVSKLSSGRLTSSQIGDSHVRILDAEGIVIYELGFQPSFHLFDVPASVDEMTYFFIIPDLENVNWLQVLTPQGEAKYEFPFDE
ncbi:MAG: hypothetical protein HN929_10910 [Chloroflexi bacterium]|jgi:hypothetical protein|nr:hypothetical protein [Chloroflexota bacterium]